MTRAEREAQLISIAEEVLIERGYENLVEKLTELGATIRRIED